MRYLVKIKYNGKNYFGIVPQPGKPTIISEIIKKIGKKPKKIRICSRTDKGVTAYENYVYFEFEDGVEFPEIINKDIKILDVKQVDGEIKFKDIVQEKTYIYVWRITEPIYNPKYIVIDNKKIVISKEKSEFQLERIKRNLKYFIGNRDFRNFTSERYQDYKCFIKNIFVKKVQDSIYFEIIGKRFLYQMIRRLVSFFISLGYGMIDEKYLDFITKGYPLEPKPPAAKPEGLVLYKIKLKDGYDYCNYNSS